MRRTARLFTFSVLVGGASLLVLLHALLTRPAVQTARTDAAAMRSLDDIAEAAAGTATDLRARHSERVASRQENLETLRRTIGSANRIVSAGRRDLAGTDARPVMPTVARRRVDARLNSASEELGAAEAFIDSAGETLTAAATTDQIDALVAELNELREAIAELAPAPAPTGADGLSIETLVALGGLVSSLSTMILSWRRDRRENERLRFEVDRLKLSNAGGSAQPATGPGVT